MRSIKDFKSGAPKTEEPATLREEVESVAAKYVGKSEDELLRALRQNVSAAKRNGTFSAEQLDNFVRIVSPSLDEASRERLNSLLLMIEQENP